MKSFRSQEHNGTKCNRRARWMRAIIIACVACWLTRVARAGTFESRARQSPSPEMSSWCEYVYEVISIFGRRGEYYIIKREDRANTKGDRIHALVHTHAPVCTRAHKGYKSTLRPRNVLWCVGCVGANMRVQRYKSLGLQVSEPMIYFFIVSPAQKYTTYYGYDIFVYCTVIVAATIYKNLRDVLGAN
jgi:hypothetical protein